MLQMPSDKKNTSILDSMKLDQALRIAKGKFKEGFFEETSQIYRDILEKFPKNKIALQGIKALQRNLTREVSNVENPTPEHMQAILSLYNLRKYPQVLAQTFQILKLFPNSDILYNILGVTNTALKQFDAAIDSFKKAIRINPHYAEVYNNMGLVLQNKNELEKAIASYQKAIKINPDYAEAYYNMGIALQGKEKPKEAIECYNQALKINPAYVESYYNMGLAYYEKGDLDAAIDNYKKVIELNSQYVKAYNNLGLALNDKGDLEAAIDSYKKALQIKPNYVEAYNNMGFSLYEKGDLDSALASYKKAIQIKPDYAEAKSNLVILLNNYNPKKEILHPIIEADREIRAIEFKYNDSKKISDDDVINLYIKSLEIIESSRLNINYFHSQVYRSNTVNLNCKRHMAIFQLYKIIPEFCFGCYKVQVEPNSFIELIKLLVVFDKIILEENNTRKCMVELRSEISGFYKGYIYCYSLKQANEIAKHLDEIIKINIGPRLSAKVKRGCSEYPFAFPDYKEINNFGPQLMNYNRDWASIEEDYDKKHSIKNKKNKIPTRSGLGLSDILAIQNWYAYAKGIGDKSVNLIKETDIFCEEKYNSAKARSKIHPFIN